MKVGCKGVFITWTRFRDGKYGMCNMSCETLSIPDIHYSIVSGDRNGFFRIDANTGFIYTAKPLDHDEYPYILLNIMADVGNTPIFGTTQVGI